MSGFEFTPPLFYFIEHTVVLLIGTTRVALRFAPAIASIVTIPLMYILGKELVDERTGVFAAIITSVSLWNIMYAQEARAYSLVIMFFVITLILWNRKNKFWIVGAVASFWTHFYSVLSFIPLVKKAKEAIIFATLTAPLWYMMYFMIINKSISSLNEINATGFTIIIDTLFQFFGFNFISMILFVALMCIGAYEIHKKNDDLGENLILSLAIPFIFAVSAAPYINFVARYLTCIFPTATVMISASHKTLGMKVFLAILIIAFIFTIPQLISFYTIPYKVDWNGIVDFPIPL
jgi:uncharacterized membrane protein